MNIFEDEIVKPINMEDFETVFTPDIRRVIEAVRKYGFDIRVIGGAVRDFLIGKTPRDVDFATDADPAELILIYDLEGIEYDAKGIVHGTVKAVFGDEKVDVTSINYRLQVKDGKIAVQHPSGWEEDAQARDLTINSMSLDLDGNLHDYVNGIDDLRAGILRFNPGQHEKIEENPDLILRWFKAMGCFENPRWPRKDYEAIERNIPLLQSIRDDSKTTKTLGSILAAKNGKQIIDTMCKMGVAKYIDISCV